MRSILQGITMAVMVMATHAAAAQVKLQYPLPKGMVQAWTGTKENTQITQYVPKGETAQAWTRMLVVSIAHGQKKQMETWRNSVEREYVEKCSKGGAVIVVYDIPLPPHGQATLTCPEKTLPHHRLVRTIQGENDFYTVEMMFNTEPSEKQIAQANAYLNQVALYYREGSGA